jgi:hypothetical protein
LPRHLVIARARGGRQSSGSSIIVTIVTAWTRRRRRREDEHKAPEPALGDAAHEQLGLGSAILYAGAQD